MNTYKLSTRGIKINGITESWFYYIEKKVAQGWILNNNKLFVMQFLDNPDAKEGEQKRITYQEYSDTVKLLFKKCVPYIIDGEPLSLQGLGTIKPRRIERNLMKLTPTNAILRKYKYNEIVKVRDREYQLTDDYCLINWARPVKGSSMLEGHKDVSHLDIYRFDINRGNNGNGLKEQFHAVNVQNHNLKYNYDYKPSNKSLF